MEKERPFLRIKQDILTEIKKAGTIIIHRHINPDPDAIGSQCGLAELILSSYPDKVVKTAGESPGGLRFLSNMDRPHDDDYTEALVIVVDTANEPRISDDRFKTGKKIIKIDHHPKDDAYGEIEWNNTKASSCSEMIADFWLSFPEELKMNEIAARLLYGGIVGDTNRFLYDATSPETMRIAARLMEYPFSHTELNNKLNTVPVSTARLMGHVLESIEVDEESGFAKVILTQKKLEEFGLQDSDTSAVVSLPSRVEGSLLWGIFVEQKDGAFRCRLRSKGPVINQIAKRHDGGGHPLASGANASDMEEVNTIVQEMVTAGKTWNKEHQQA